MTRKERVLSEAQRDANNTGRSMAILNLNAMSHLYVYRDWDDRLIGSRELVMRINPQVKS